MITIQPPVERWTFRRVLNTVARLISRLAPFLIAIAAWETFALISHNRFFPHLHEVFWSIVGSFWSNTIILAQGGGSYGYSWHVWKTLSNFILCLFVGSGIGFCMALMANQWSLLRRILSVVVEPWEVIPPLMIIPITLSVMGATLVSNFLAGSFYAFVASVVLTTGALQQIPQNFVTLAKLGGASRWWIVLHVHIPAIAIQSLSSLKSVASLTLGIVVLLEYLAAPSGIGRVMKYAMSYHAITLLVVVIFWAIMIGIVFDVFIDILSWFCLRWAWRRT